MAFNRIVDARIDAENPRTSRRHLPAGLLSVPVVAAFTAACAAGFVASTLLFLPNRLPVILSIPVLAFLCGYSYAKRFTSLAHYWLAPRYALADRRLDRHRRHACLASRAVGAGGLFLGGRLRHHLRLPGRRFRPFASPQERAGPLWRDPALWIAGLSHLITVACFVGLWETAHLGPLFLASVIGVGLLLAYEHWLVRPDDLTRINVAFFNVNAIISLGLFVVGLLDILIERP